MSCKTVLTTCPFCGCGCNLALQVVNEKIVDVIPVKTHEVSRGSLCIKGLHVRHFVDVDERAKEPLIRKDGLFSSVSWDEALFYTAERLKETREKYGPDSIGVLSSAKGTNEENYIIQKFARAVLGTNNIDHCARLCHSSTVVGLIDVFGSGAMTNSIEEFENADCVLVTGSNTTEQHPMIGSNIARAKAKGAKLIVIDPRRTQLAELADIHLRQRPGTDIAWINGIMRFIIKEKLLDMDFIERRTEGFEELKKNLERYTPKLVEKITGIPPDSLQHAAEMYSTAKRAMIVFSVGITQHVNGTDIVRALADLAMLTGNVGKESTGVNPLRGQNNVQGACDVGALPEFLPGYQKLDDEKAVKKFEKAWRCKLPRGEGLTEVEMMNAVKEGKLRALYVVGENPMLSDPDTSHVETALRSLDFLVVQDIFHTETAEFADVFLPAASFAEKEGTFTATDRRIQRVRKAIEPLGNSKPDWWIIKELARYMGSNEFEYDSPAEVMKEVARLAPIYGGISYERLDNGESLTWPCPTSRHKGTKFLHRGKFTRGKGKFVPVHHKEPAEKVDEEYPFILTTGRIIFHYHTGTMTRKIRLLDWEVPTGFVEINPGDAIRLNVGEGEIVRVKSRRGEINIRALVTERVPPGVIFIPFHFAESRANILTNAALDPEAKIPEYKVCAARIEKIGGGR